MAAELLFFYLNAYLISFIFVRKFFRTFSMMTRLVRLISTKIPE